MKYNKEKKLLPVSISLVVPIFNNEVTLVKQLKLCDKILKSTVSKYEIIVCDDESKDKSVILLKKYFKKNKNFRCYFNKFNLGIAKNITSLYKKARNDYIVLFSVDGDWVPNDIGRLIKYAYKNRADMVIGKRSRKNYSYYRKIVSYCYNALPKLIFGIDTIDAGSIKLISKKIITSIPTTSKSVFVEAELIIRSYKKNFKIMWLPIEFKKENKYTGTGGKLSLVIQSFFDLIILRFKLI